MVWLHSRAGVAPGAVAQSRGDGVGSGAIGKRPPGDAEPVSASGAPGGHC